ncbi:phosphatase PAP2 family protein [uncultured Massilia sp.]|uniref:phosphatase PAP2 family protein n=1 Tax=uncultured Massilia sp. TaxID=169973 RepID=UPI0025D422B1|nr:phosphatase PAP2 family protein [uncultured Massilia sp.]
MLVRRRLVPLALNWLAFGTCYPLANLLAHRQQVRRSLATALDAAIPFLPWAIVPYASSGLLFTLVFFLVRSNEALRTASRRLLLATVAGCLLFAALPARSSMARPADIGGWPAPLFAWLDLVDRPYNQCPSLHVAYCVIVWLAWKPLCHGALRWLLAAWLMLVAASTVLTWQHHLVDVAGGLLLGLGAAWAVRPGATRRHGVSFYYGIAAGVLLLVGVAFLRSWVAACAAASLLLVALAYRRRHAGFLGKRAGRHPLSSWLLFWPYLAGYRLTWLLVRRRERGRAPFSRQAPGLWVGRRLDAREAALLPRGCHVVDLCGELPETAALRQARYHHFPLLDLQAPRPSQLRPVLATLARLEAEGHPVYLHCAMGYSRSRLVSRLHLRRKRRCPSRSTS